MKKLVKGTLQLIPLAVVLVVAIMFLVPTGTDALIIVGSLTIGIGIAKAGLKLTELGWNNIREYFKGRKVRGIKDKWCSTAGKLANIPWPDCYDKCEIVKTLGVSECDNVCPGKKEEV